MFVYILYIFLFSECLLFSDLGRDSDLQQFVLDYILMCFCFLNCLLFCGSGRDTDLLRLCSTTLCMYFCFLKCLAFCGLVRAIGLLRITFDYILYLCVLTVWLYYVVQVEAVCCILYFSMYVIERWAFCGACKDQLL